MKEIFAKDLKPGHVLILPFNAKATVESVKVGRLYVTLRTEHGNSRVELYEIVLVQEDVH